MITRRTLLGLAGGTVALGLSLATATQALADEFKAGLLTQGSATESGWNLIAYNALQRVGNELGAEVSNVELDDNPASYEKAFRDYASRGANVIIGHGFQFEDAAMEVAPDFPDTVFLVTSSVTFEDNVVGVNLDAYQPFFLIGMLAGLRGDKGGYIGGVPIPPITQAAIGFKNGAEYVNPNFETSSVMTGSWSDLATAKEAALSMIASGANFVVPNANVAALGVFQAASETGTHIGSFGAFDDYTEKAPANILGNYNPNLGQGFVDIITSIKDGSFAPEANIVFGLQDEEVMFMNYNENAANPVTAEELAKLKDATAKLISGEIDPTIE